MPSSQMDAARIATALNDLGHIALAHPLEDARRAKGAAQLKEEFAESATLVLELVEREERVNPGGIPCAAEVKAALSRFHDEVPTVNFEDAASMARLRACARQALEAFGLPLPA